VIHPLPKVGHSEGKNKKYPKKKSSSLRICIYRQYKIILNEMFHISRKRKRYVIIWKFNCGYAIDEKSNV
jgi:hypothetical protein